MANRCAKTGKVIDGSGDAVWDDGEWISWDWINQQLHEQELRKLYPNAPMELIKIFEELVYDAAYYRQVTDRYLPIFGELGELFAEITYGIKRHKPNTQGSDGKLGNDYVEVKTITPEKKSEQVAVKRQGNFNKLVIVKISERFEFEAKMIDRKAIGKGNGGKVAKVYWKSIDVQEIRRSFGIDI